MFSLTIFTFLDAPFIFFMTLMASLFNAPVNPVVASTLFIISYVRPVKFWEKNYKWVLFWMYLWIQTNHILYKEYVYEFAIAWSVLCIIYILIWWN